jgi:hypothetical protein
MLAGTYVAAPRPVSMRTRPLALPTGTTPVRLGTGLSWTPVSREIGTPPDVRAGFPANSIAGCWWGCQATRDWLGSKLLLVGSILMPYRCNPGLVAIDLSAMISGQGHHTSNPPVLVSPLPRNMLPRLHGVALPYLHAGGARPREVGVLVGTLPALATACRRRVFRERKIGLVLISSARAPCFFC